MLLQRILSLVDLVASHLAREGFDFASMFLPVVSSPVALSVDSTERRGTTRTLERFR